MIGMSRRELIENCFQRGQQLTLTDAEYRGGVDEFLRWLIAADHIENDVTTRALDLHHRATAIVQAKQNGTLAGMQEVRYLLDQYPMITVEEAAADGCLITKGATILMLSLEIDQLLGLERTILNIIGRMSGIATQTQHLISLVNQQPDAPMIAGTRKTPWMMLDKKAVYLGGGLTHRLTLRDAILVKDNHLAAFQKQMGIDNPEQAIPLAIATLVRNLPPRDYFEIEVENVAQARAALSTFETVLQESPQQPTMIVMLDNFGPTLATEFINEVCRSAVYNHVLFEASGDITEETIPAWSTTDVDVLSLGALTHSVKTFNVSMMLG
jgi:nicotinate-nucleotide pyrophosphorylase (carboxylating)